VTRSHATVVTDQFGPRAKAYVESAVHARGADLDALETIVGSACPEHALDLGAGGGHVSYLMARHAGRVTASDLASEMTAAIRAAAHDRGLDNVETVDAPAERLPFADETFDFLACRFSAHHWRDFAAGTHEARRVLKPGATAIFIDVYAPGAAMLDTHLQAIELLRDTSHARNYTSAEWLGTLGRSGFALSACRTWRLRMDFANWTARMCTPETNARAIRALQVAASEETRTHFAIESDGSFLLDILMVEVVAE
jgi:SAM-dependent methyltransferase